jgi:hypothetical protein
VITSRIETPLQGSHRDAQESVRDGWYIDLDTTISCDLRSHRPGNSKGSGIFMLTAGNAPAERIEIVQNGDAETGFPVEWRISTKSEFTRPDGTKRATTSEDKMKIIEFVEGPLDPALFEVPAGFKKVARIDANEPGEEQSMLIVAWRQIMDRVENLLH